MKARRQAGDNLGHRTAHFLNMSKDKKKSSMSFSLRKPLLAKIQLKLLNSTKVVKFNLSGKPPATQNQTQLQRSMLNRKSLERLENNYLNSNYLQHIESKLRLELANQNNIAQTSRDGRQSNSINANSLRIPRSTNKNSLIKISPHKPDSPSIQIKQNQNYSNQNTNNNNLNNPSSSIKNLTHLNRTPQQIYDQKKPLLTFQQLQEKFKDKCAPQLTTRVDINSSRIREKKLKKDKKRPKKFQEDSSEHDQQEQLRKKQRSQSFKQRQAERYLLKVTYEEEASDDECNISDDKSDKECPVNKNEQRKYEIERFVFKMSESQKHIVTSQQWFHGLERNTSDHPKLRRDNNMSSPNVNAAQQKTQSMKNQLTALQGDKITQNDNNTKYIASKLYRNQNDETAITAITTQLKNRKLSTNCNQSIISTNRAPISSNILRQSYKDDVDALMPVETMEDAEDDLKREDNLFKSLSKSSVQQRETMPSLNNQSMNQETPSQKQEQPIMTQKQKQLLQVSKYLNQYQKNLFGKKKKTESTEIDQKINMIGSQINNRILKMIIAKDDLQQPSTIKQIKQLILVAGISNDMRKKFWGSLIKIKELKKQFPRSQFRKTYIDYNKSGALSDIKKDVRRTFQEVYYFQVPEIDDRYDYSKNPLTNILVAYSNQDRQIGYTQGMNYLAAIFYMIFLDEYEAFLALYYVMYTLNWRSVYNLSIRDQFNEDRQNSTQPKLQNLLKMIQKKLYNEIPKIYHFLQEKNILPAAVYSQLFLTLGLNNCSLDNAYQIIDLFLLEGEKVLIKIIVNCLKLKEKKILSFKQEFDLAQYLQQKLLNECLKEYGLKDLLEEEL
eukprot:403348553